MQIKNIKIPGAFFVVFALSFFLIVMYLVRDSGLELRDTRVSDGLSVIMFAEIFYQVMPEKQFPALRLVVDNKEYIMDFSDHENRISVVYSRYSARPALLDKTIHERVPFVLQAALIDTTSIQQMEQWRLAISEQKPIVLWPQK